jgi:hypothetical protein
MRKHLCQQVTLVVMCVHICNLPLVARTSFADKMVSYTLTLFPEYWTGNRSIHQHWLIIPFLYAGRSQGIPIICNLYQSPRMYSKHCFIAMNSDPKLLDSTLVCFLDIQYTSAQLGHTKNPVLECLVTVSDAWSASTFACIVKPRPLGSGCVGKTKLYQYTS